MLTTFRTSLTICILLGFPGMVAAENAEYPESIRDVTSDLTPYQRDRIQVTQGDTIWSIARVNRPQSVTIEQMVLALYFSNPEAFAAQNISQLKAGSQLIVPPAILFTQISPGDAKELLGKLRSGAAYDTSKILHRLKQSRHTAPRHSEKNTVRMPATNTEAGTAAPLTDALKSIPVIEIHTLQPSAPQETVAAVQPQAATPQSGVQVEQDTVAPRNGQQDVEKTMAAPAPVSTVETAISAATPADNDATSPTPCTTEDCRMALTLKTENRLIAIQNEIKQLNETLILQQQLHPTVAAANETATATPTNDVAAPITGTNAWSKIWASIKALDPVALLGIAAGGVLFEIVIRALVKLVASLRNSRGAITAPPAADVKSQPQPEPPDQRTASAPDNKPSPVEPPPKRFEPVVLSSADELGELSSPSSIPNQEYTSMAATGDRQVIAASQEPASYSVTAEQPAPKEPIPAVAHNGYVDDDLGLDFGLQDGKLPGKNEYR